MPLYHSYYTHGSRKAPTPSRPERCEAAHSCVDLPSIHLTSICSVERRTRMLWSETMGFAVYGYQLDACSFFPSVMVPVGLLLLDPRLADRLLDLPLVLLEHVLHVPAGRHQGTRVVDPLVPPSKSLKS